MSRLRSFASRFSRRIKQEDIEDQDELGSLSARAFRKRLLDEEVAGSEVGLVAGAARPARVAVYHPPTNNTGRQFLRIGLIFVAPVLAIALILWLTFSIVSQNQVVAPVATESIFDGDIPVPAGVRPISRAQNYNQANLAVAVFRRYLPGYTPVIRQVNSYISPMSLADVNRYYKSRLVEPKPPPWQTYGDNLKLGDQNTSMYVRAGNGAGVLEGLLVQLEVVTKDKVQSDARYYDKQAQAGETVITLSTANMRQ